eukprot:SAG11_NODE_23601_length_385_cov_3.251748_1_plen_61_part_10
MRFDSIARTDLRPLCGMLPEKMKNRYKNVFNVKSIKAFSDELEEPRELLDAVVDDINDAPL